MSVFNTYSICVLEVDCQNGLLPVFVSVNCLKSVTTCIRYVYLITILIIQWNLH